MISLTWYQILQCASSETDDDCSQAQNICNNNILSPLSGQWDVYYVLAKSPSGYPADITNWLNNQSTEIGAETTWGETNLTVYNNFYLTGSCDCRVRPPPGC